VGVGDGVLWARQVAVIGNRRDAARQRITLGFAVGTVIKDRETTAEC
jgi:hypothetical protein